jgi:hypothetical protein
VANSGRGRRHRDRRPDGLFAARLLALLDASQLVAIDAVGNRSTPTVVLVERRSVEGGVPLNGLAL